MKRKGRKGKVMPRLLQGTLWGKPFRKGEGARDRGDVMPSCALFFRGFLEKKEDNRERNGVKRKGMRAMLCPFIARNVVG